MKKRKTVVKKELHQKFSRVYCCVSMRRIRKENIYNTVDEEHQEHGHRQHDQITPYLKALIQQKWENQEEQIIQLDLVEFSIHESQEP